MEEALKKMVHRPSGGETEVGATVLRRVGTNWERNACSPQRTMIDTIQNATIMAIRMERLSIEGLARLERIRASFASSSFNN